VSDRAHHLATTVAARTRRASAAIGAVLALFTAVALAADPPGPARSAASADGEEPAMLRVLNRDVVMLRARVGGLPPHLRVQRTQQRLRELPNAAIDQPLALADRR